MSITEALLFCPITPSSHFSVEQGRDLIVGSCHRGLLGMAEKCYLSFHSVFECVLFI